MLSEIAQVEYKCSELYYPDDDLSVAWNDPEIGIAWPIEEPLLSKKDGEALALADVQERLATYPG